MAIVDSNDIGKKICEILGLGEDVTSITLDIKLDSAVMVTVTRYVHKEEFDDVMTLVERYNLTPKE